jgi:hypothetical protein
MSRIGRCGYVCAIARFGPAAVADVITAAKATIAIARAR